METVMLWGMFDVKKIYIGNVLIDCIVLESSGNIVLSECSHYSGI